MTALKKPSFNEVKSMAEQRKLIAYQLAYEQLPNILKGKKGAIQKESISFQPINMRAMKELRRWEIYELRRAAWDWDKVENSYKNHPKKFDLTLWHKGFTLCSASIGRPTFGGSKIRLDIIEANPAGSALEGLITDINIIAYEAYARVNNCTQLRIMQPVNESVKNYYLSKKGFSFDNKGNFCFKELG